MKQWRWLLAGFAATVLGIGAPLAFVPAGVPSTAAAALGHQYDVPTTEVVLHPRSATPAGMTPATNLRIVAPLAVRSSPRTSPEPLSLVSGFFRATKGVPRAGVSALEDASQAGFKAAEGPINISRKHFAGAGGRYNKFAEGVDVDSVVREALRSPNAMFRPNPGGGYRIDTDLGRAIGQGGRRTVRTVVAEDGRVITAFPYGPKAP